MEFLKKNGVVLGIVLLGIMALVVITYFSQQKVKENVPPVSKEIIATSTNPQVYRIDFADPLVISSSTVAVMTLNSPPKLTKIQTGAVCGNEAVAVMNRARLVNTLEEAMHTGIIKTPKETVNVLKVKLEVPRQENPQEGREFCTGFHSQSTGWLWNMKPIILPEGVRNTKVSVLLNLEKEDIDLVGFLFNNPATLSAMQVEPKP